MSEITKLQKKLIIKKIDKETLNIQILDNNILLQIVGEFNENLKQLEKLTQTTLFFRGNSITAKGKLDGIINVSEAIKFLINKFLLTNNIDKSDIILSVNKNLNSGNNSNVQSFAQLIKTPRKSVIARSQKQSDYIKALRENDIVIALGPAGTGKSFLAVSVAVTLLMEKKVERVILSRPAVEAGEKLGFLPGDMKDKVDPYLRLLYDALYELFGFEKIDKKIESGEIEIAPLAFMRGRTLKNCFAILDEAQNATETQIKMFLTRIGENSKLVVNGDPTQVDLVNKAHSGLIKSKNILSNVEEIKIIEFDHNDVVRHPLVSKIIKAYQKKTMIKADVLIANKKWKKYIGIPDYYINKRLKKINKKLTIFKKKNLQFTILLSGDNEIKKLNSKFRKKNKTTDILSFPFHNKKDLNILIKKEKNQIYLGDIIINLNKMISKIKDKKFFLNFDKIWIHGLAHLFGHRHKSNDDFIMMTKFENKLIKYSK